MNMLEELFNGSIRPYENQIPQASYYKKSCEVLTDSEKSLTAFLEALPNAEKEQYLLSQMITAQLEVNAYNETQRFIEGFRLGARFMLDTFVMPDNGVIRDI